MKNKGFVGISFLYTTFIIISLAIFTYVQLDNYQMNLKNKLILEIKDNLENK